VVAPAAAAALVITPSPRAEGASCAGGAAAVATRACLGRRTRDDEDEGEGERVVVVLLPLLLLVVATTRASRARHWRWGWWGARGVLVRQGHSIRASRVPDAREGGEERRARTREEGEERRASSLGLPFFVRDATTSGVGSAFGPGAQPRGEWGRCARRRSVLGSGVFVRRVGSEGAGALERRRWRGERASDADADADRARSSIAKMALKKRARVRSLGGV
jgi:hypothetical protein